MGMIVCLMVVLTACNMDSKAKNNEQQQIFDFKSSIEQYACGEISYEESFQCSKGLVEEVSSDLMKQLDELQYSKNSYTKGNLAYEAGNYIESYQSLLQVMDKDVENFAQATSIMNAIEKVYIDHANEMADSYFYDEANRTLSQLIEVSSNKILIETKEAIDKKKDSMVLYSGDVRHIFFHSLIANTDLAFDGDYMEQGYNYWMTTVDEFKKMLDEMHKRDFILIDINLLYNTEIIDGKRTLKKKDLYLPIDKKPLIISLDDLNYYSYMENDGFADRLVLDQSGQVATLTKLPDGDNLIARDNDCVPILDVFIEEHPDFSYQGAKGIIGVTGYEGILGYRTDDSNSPTYQEDIADVKAIVKRLKETGWRFASHSYGHINFDKQSLDRVKKDSNQWDKEVGSLIGDTNLFIYPYGAVVQGHEEKFKELQDHGFDIFFGVCAYTTLRFNSGALLMDRCNLDGYRMTKAPYQLVDLFDVEDVFDSKRPPLAD